MDTTKVAFFDTKPYDRRSFENTNQEFGFSIKYFKEHLNRDTAILARDYPVVCAFVNDSLDKETVDQLAAGGTGLIAMRCAGYNNVDLEAVYGRIHVMRVPAYSPYAVAEHAAALLLALNRKTHRAYYRTRDANFNINGLLGFDLFGKTAGVVGAGKIGRVMVGILRGFGMRVLVYDRYQDQDFAASSGCEYVSLEDLYAQADVISLHCPLTPDTHHMINARSLQTMRDGVFLINTSRGHLIDTRALIEALKAGKVGAAGLDVYEEEGDYFFEDLSDQVITDDVLARLLTFHNVLVTSHQAFFTREAIANIARTTLENVRQYLHGDTLANEICYRCDAQPCRKKTEGKCF